LPASTADAIRNAGNRAKSLNWRTAVLRLCTAAAAFWAVNSAYFAPFSRALPLSCRGGKRRRSRCYAQIWCERWRRGGSAASSCQTRTLRLVEQGGDIQKILAARLAQPRPSAPGWSDALLRGESVAIQPITIADRPFDSRRLESAIAKGGPGQAAHIGR